MSAEANVMRLKTAFVAGKLVGLERVDPRPACPFSPNDRASREAWLKGFAAGRAQMARFVATG